MSLLRIKELEAQVQRRDARIEELESSLEDAHHDTLRMDWLADKDNAIGNVQLPAHIVQNNVHSLRAAIDASMEIGK